MVKIRLKRGGKKFVAYYKVVVADARSPRDGKFIEEVGTYDPVNKQCNVKRDRVLYWLGVGAQPTDVVKKLLKLQKIWEDFKSLKHVNTPPVQQS